MIRLMNIALILPAFSENLEIIKKRFAKFYFKEGNVMPPLGLGYIAAILEREGHKVIIIDDNALRLSISDLINRLKKFKPQLIGFSVLTHIFPYAVKMIKIIKKILPSVDIIVGGQHVGLYPKNILEIKAIDYAIAGEGEITIQEFINVYEKYKNGEIPDKDKELGKINGLIFRDKSDNIIVNSPRELIHDLDTIPFPARHLYEMDKYTTLFMDKTVKAASIITARGCPFQCNYCAERFSTYRKRSVKNILDEIEEVYNKYGVRDIYFNDGTFTVSKKRTIEICKGIIDQGLKITFNLRSRVDTVDEEVIKYLAKAGCDRINYGFESGDNQILKNLHKNTTVEQMIKAVTLTKKYGIKILAFFMLGSPGETKKTIKKTISLAIALEPEFVQFTRLNPFSGSELYMDYLQKTGNDVWLDFSMGKTECKDVIMPQSNFTKKKLDKLVARAYRQFYFRPRYMIKKIKEVNSLEKLTKYFKAAISII